MASAHAVTVSSPIRAALIGFGLAGESFHAPLIAADPSFRLTHVVTSDPDRAARARERFPGIEVLPRADDLWAIADALDLVVVATPNASHAALGGTAVEAGLAVVIDKPLATSAAEGGRLVEEARRRGCFFTVFHNRRWDGDFLTLRRLIDEGRLGRVHRFESRFDRWRPKPKAGWRESGDPEQAGGLLFDLGSHLIDQALVLFGPVTRVYAEVDRRRPGVQTDDDTFLALTHAAGVRSHLRASVVAPPVAPRISAFGDLAAYVKYGLDPQEAALRSTGRVTVPGWGEEPEDAWGYLAVGEDSRPVPTVPGDYPAFYRNVARALLAGAPPVVDPYDAVRGLEIIEAALLSARRGQTIEIT